MQLLRILVVLVIVYISASCVDMPQAVTREFHPSASFHPKVSQSQKDLRIQKIEAREKARNGITVHEPKVYDDALLQQMLQQAEARLATLQLIDQTQIAKNIGALSGASQSISSFGLNVQGPSVPGVDVTEKSPPNANSLATRDVVTKNPQINPPTATAPAPTTALPSGFSVSASDILNEQMQLTTEINGLRLLLEGALSDFFVRCKGQTTKAFVQDFACGNTRGTKLKTTLGFPISIKPDQRYKNAVAIVEVEVERGNDALNDEPPAITSLLPLEKTYNVATITDKAFSIGGGIATQILGVSGSWLRGHKTYYVVREQDTVALNYQPDSDNRVGFLWQFRPVLGQEYVKASLKHTFVQLAFAVPSDATTMGKVTVRTYWRRYDRKRGLVKEIIRESLDDKEWSFEIPRYRSPEQPLNSRDNLEDLGGGQMLVKLPGRILSRSYVRIGATLLSEGQRFIHEHDGVRFIAPISDLATNEVFLARDGFEVPLKFSGMRCSIFTPLRITDPPQVTAINEANSRVTIKINQPQLLGPTMAPLILLIGKRVFGYSDAPIDRDATNGTLTAVVPTALLRSDPEITVKILFAPKACSATSELATRLPSSQAESLVLFKQSTGSMQFLVNGHRLSQAKIVFPAGLSLDVVGITGVDNDTLRLVTLTDDQLKNHKFLLLQKNDERPFLVSIPSPEAKKPDPPKARERLIVDANEAVIDGEGLKDLEKVTFKKQAVPFEVAEDGKSVRLSGLRNLGITAAAMTQTVELTLKSGKATVKLEIVNTKIETVPK